MDALAYGMEHGTRIGPEFFRRNPAECAWDLIGAIFRWDGGVGRIVETEAYCAIGDEACHTWFRPSARKFIAEHAPGAAYVYLNYGVHWLFNVLVKGGEEAGFVLFRAVEPLEDIPQMRVRTGNRGPDVKMGAGPGKLTKMLGIRGDAHGAEFLLSENRGIFAAAETPEIVTGPRIGISREVGKPWRFGAAGSAALSRRFP